MHYISHCDYEVESGMLQIMVKSQCRQGNGWAQAKSGKMVRAAMGSNRASLRKYQEGLFVERETANVIGLLEEMSLRGVSEGKSEERGRTGLPRAMNCVRKGKHGKQPFSISESEVQDGFGKKANLQREASQITDDYISQSRIMGLWVTGRP